MKIWLWPLKTGSNVDLVSKHAPPIATTRREQFAVFPLISTTLSFETHRGSYHPPPPRTSALWNWPCTDEGLTVNARILHRAKVTWGHMLSQISILHIIRSVYARETHWDHSQRSISILSKVTGKTRVWPHMTSNGQGEVIESKLHTGHWDWAYVRISWEKLPILTGTFGKTAVEHFSIAL